MIYWNELYENPRRLTSDWGHSRIFAPEAYAHVRTRQLVPIAHTEALTLAAHFPICWRLQKDRFDLCILRSLLDDGRGHPARPTSATGTLPLVLRAFPIIATAPSGGTDDIWIDDIVADRPTDIGAPLLMADGRLSRGASLRVQSAAALRQAIDQSQHFTEALVDGQLLEPWPLDFELGPDGQRVCIDDLQVVRPAAQAHAGLLRFLHAFGAEAAMFLTAHRISLFRIAILLQAARAAVAKDAPSRELASIT